MSLCKRLLVKFKISLHTVKVIFTVFVFSFSRQVAQSQIFVQESVDTAAVVSLVNNILVTSCINISNIQYTGALRAIGSFDGTASNIGLDSGIILTNGRANNAVGPNNSPNRSTNNALGGDAQLTAIAGTNTFDATILEFDFIPYSDTIKFDYVYASEEYNEYVGLFNDPMAFFISGPGFGTPYNMARVPGTATPVSINTINNGYSANCPATGPCGNCAYYFDNCGGTTVQYDGFTVPMTAFAVVQPCVQYHLKIAVADALDRIYDSAVLLKAGSFTAGEAANVTLGLINNVNTLTEGCSNGGFTFTRLDSTDNSQPVTVNYTISGNATNGTDYSTITTSITIPAGQNSVNLNINALFDGNAEGNETLTISLNSSGCDCVAPPSISLTIVDNNDALTGSSSGGDTICLGESVILTATASGSTGPYSYSWDNGAGSGSSVSVSPVTTTTYTVTISNGCNGQTVTSQQTVAVVQAGFVVAGNSTQCLTGNSFTFNNTGSSGPGINHTWDFGDSSPTESTVNATHTYSTAGTFTVTHTITSGSCIQSTTETVDVVNSPTAIITGNSAYCTGSNTVLSAATSTPGSGTITSYQWQLNGNNISGATASTYTVSNAGNYTVVVTNSNSCSTVSAVFTVISSNSPTATIAGNNSFCNGNNTVLSAQGSLPGSGSISSYQWQLNGSNIGGATSSTYTATAAGNYTVIVTNSNGCSSTSSAFSVTVYANPVATITGSHSYCTGSNLTLSSSSSTAGSGTISSYQWQLNGTNISGATSSTYDVTSSGNYTVIITNSNGCSTTSAAWTVTEFSNPSVSITSSTDVTCAGNNDGTATAVASGGSGVYTYLWLPGGQTTAAVNNLSAGSNTIVVTDGNGCTDSASVTIMSVDNTPPVAVCQNITVYLNPLGTVSVSGAEIDGGSTDNCGISSVTASPNSFDCNNLGDNNVTLTVTDANGNSSTCVAVVTVEYSNPPSPDCGNVTAYVSSSGTVSIDESDIILNLQSLCGIGSIELSQTDFDCSNLGTNSVDLTVIYTSGDSASCTANVNILDTVSPVIINCPADIQTTPNVPGCMASVSWTIPDISDNCSYSVTSSHTPGDTLPVGITTVNYDITDPSGNTAHCEFNIEVLSIPMSLNLVPVQYQCGYNISCTGSSDGSVAATITGGCPPYIYLWDNGATTQTINNLSAGSYQVTVTDANGGQVSGTISLAEPSPIVTNSVQLSLYSGGLNISCNGASDGSISADFAGGADCELYTYLWSGPNGFNSSDEDISGLAAGNYTLTLTDANGCIHNESVTLDEPTGLTINSTITDVSCFGISDGSATITASGGSNPFTYLWPNGETTTQLSNLSAGDYTVLITDANGCSDSTTVSVQQPAEIAIAVQVLSDYNGFPVSCYNSTDGSVTVTASGGNTPYTYTWSTSETTQTISNLASGNYSVLITDNNGCISQSNIQFDAPEELTSFFIGDSPACNGNSNGSLEIVAAGGVSPYLYLWSNGQTVNDLVNIPSGNYSVTITDQNGCTSSNDTTLSEPTQINADTVSITNVSCFGLSDGAIDITVSGGTPQYFYQWSNGSSTQDIQGLAAGTYQLTVRDANACSDTLTVVVTQPAELLVTAISPGTVCPGTEAAFTANVSGGNGNLSYSWSNGQSGDSISVYPQQPVSLNVTVTDGQGCSSVSGNVTVNVYPTPTANFSISQSQSCTYPITISTINNSNGGLQYTWDDGNGSTYNNISPSFTYNNSGNFVITLIATNGAGCNDTATSIFNVYETPVADFSLSANSGCPPLSIDFTDLSTDALQYSWTFGDNETSVLSNPTHTYYETGNYSVTLVVTGEGGCSNSISLSPITVFPTPTAQFTWDYEDPFDPDGHILFSNLSQGAENYQWNFGDGNTSTETNPINNYQASGNYLIILFAENEFGCTDSVSEFIEPEIEAGLYVPNVMILGNNDETGIFLPKGRGLARYNCAIFDKWGNLIWESNVLENGRPVESWDGRYKGQIVPMGAYVWYVSGVFEDGRVWQGMRMQDNTLNTIGSVTLIK